MLLALAGNGDDATDLTAVQQMWGQIGVKLRIDQVDNATRTARYREATSMRHCRLDQRHRRPEPDHVLLRLLPEHRLAAFRLAGRAGRRALREEPAGDRPGQAPRQYKEIQEIYNGAAPIIFLYETPYPVALRNKAKGFVQIPLGNNIFEAAYLDK